MCGSRNSDLHRHRRSYHQFRRVIGISVMARRRGSGGQSIIFTTAIILIGGFIISRGSEFLSRIQTQIAGRQFEFTLGIITIVTVIVIGMMAINHFNKETELRIIKNAILTACSQNRDTILARNKIKLTTPDEYGLVSYEKWNKELDKFIIKLVIPSIPFIASKPQYAPYIREILDRHCDDLIASLSLRHTEASIRNGFDYEAFVGDLLKDQGWDVSVTPASGDQGADVIARRGPETVVIQCKFYTGAVGNKAVQEVAAARVHYGATQAAVVSKSGFTASARQLAATNDVALLHHDELSTL